MVDCAKVLRKLPPLHDGELAGQTRAAVERHLEACPACRRELEQLRADMSLLAETGVPELQPYLTTRVMAEVRSRLTARARFITGLSRILGSTAFVLVVSACISVGALLGSRLGRRDANAVVVAEELTVSVNEQTFADVYASVVRGE
jgi:anti-sigma factor RsiW